MESAVAVSPVVEMQEIQTRLEQLAAVSSQLEAVDLIRETETCKALMSAIQARATAVMEALRHNEEALRDVPADRRGKGLGAEIGLARMESPTRGAQHLKHAGLLLQDLPHTYAALARGHIREEHAYAGARLLVSDLGAGCGGSCVGACGPLTWSGWRSSNECRLESLRGGHRSGFDFTSATLSRVCPGLMLKRRTCVGFVSNSHYSGCTCM